MAKKKINANDASFEELYELPGISKKTAKIMLNERPFESLSDIEDLLKENGVKKIKEIISNLTVEEIEGLDEYEEMVISDEEEVSREPHKFKVQDWSGSATLFDRLRFRHWLQRNLQISEGRSRLVTQNIETDFAFREVVSPQELVIKASRLAIHLPYSMRDANTLAFYSPAMMTPVLGSGLMAGMSVPGVSEAAEGLGKFIGFIKDYYGGDWREDNGGTKLTLESGGGLLFGDDGTAPHFDAYFNKRITCCNPKLGGKGVKIRFSFHMTDDSGNLGNDSGVDEIEVAAFDELKSGKVVKHTLGKAKLKEKDSDKTEDGIVKKKYKVCVPCRLIKDGIVQLMMMVKDHDDNRQIQFYFVPIPKSIQGDCCKGD